MQTSTHPVKNDERLSLPGDAPVVTKVTAKVNCNTDAPTKSLETDGVQHSKHRAHVKMQGAATTTGASACIRSCHFTSWQAEPVAVCSVHLSRPAQRKYQAQAAQQCESKQAPHPEDVPGTHTAIATALHTRQVIW